MPAYLNYIKASKQTTCLYNCSTAQHFLKTELAKKSSGSDKATDDAVADLNIGAKKSPYDKGKDAFVTNEMISPGVVLIDAPDIRNSTTGDIITIECEWTGDGVADGSTLIKVE